MTMNNTIKLQLLDADGRVVQEAQTKNTMNPSIKDLATALYLGSVNPNSMSSGGGLVYFGNNSYVYNLTNSSNVGNGKIVLMDDTYGLMGNNMISKLYDINKVNQPAATGISTTQLNTMSSVTGYNVTLTQTNTGTKGGVYLPSVSGVQSNNDGTVSYKYVWEWATSQGNGVIKAIGIYNADDRNYGGMIYSNASQGPVYYSTNKYYASGSGSQVGQYIGYKVDGSDKLFYYRDLNADGNNNINIYRWTNGKLVTTPDSTKVLNITGSASGLTGAGYNSTAYCNGFFYTITAMNGTSVTFKKADETTLTYGSTINRTYTSIAGFGMPYWVFSDNRYVYAMFYSSSTYNSYLLKIDSTDDSATVTAIVTGRNNLSNLYTMAQYITVCPFTGNVIWNAGAMTWFANSTAVADLAGSACLFNFATNCLTINYNNDIVTLNRVRYCTGGNYLSYAELSSPITKTSQNSLRIEYTFTYSA